MPADPRVRLSCTTLLVAAPFLAAPALGQTRLLGIDTTPGGNTLVEFDPATGALTSLMPVTGITGAIGSLTRDEAAGVTYLSSSSFDELWTFDPATGVATLVGPYNVGSGVVMQALEWDSLQGRLYGLSSTSSVGADLFEIDTTTGQATAVGITGVTGANGSGLAFAAGTMYLANTGADALYTVDLTTAATTLVGPFGAGTNIGAGLAYDPQLGLYAEDNLGDALYTLDLTTGVATLIATHAPMNIISLVFVGNGALGSAYCAANTNSTGAAATILATGSAVALDNDVTLTATALPANAFGFFLVSDTQGFVANPGGSQGNLCVSGAIGRYVGPGQVLNSGATGEFSLVLDLTQTPTPTGLVSVNAGDTRNFQAWYRDAVAGAATSNFTDGREIAFQ